jgi:hypothetical protein
MMEWHMVNVTAFGSVALKGSFSDMALKERFSNMALKGIFCNLALKERFSNMALKGIFL